MSGQGGSYKWLVGFTCLLGALYLATVILGAMAAGRGEEFRYPMSIRFVS